MIGGSGKHHWTSQRSLRANTLPPGVKASLSMWLGVRRLHSEWTTSTKREYKARRLGQEKLCDFSKLRAARSSDLLRGDGGERCKRLPLHLAADTHGLNRRIQRNVGYRQNLAGGDVACQRDVVR